MFIFAHPIYLQDTVQVRIWMSPGQNQGHRSQMVENAYSAM